MKVNRNYRFVLTNIPNSMLETEEIRIDNEEITGERMFASECHYYAESCYFSFGVRFGRVKQYIEAVNKK